MLSTKQIEIGLSESSELNKTKSTTKVIFFLHVYIYFQYS